MKKALLALAVFAGLFAGTPCLRAAERLAAPWELNYGDGSGNGFHFRQEVGEKEARFEYVPVRPEQSSTGTYSGGEPKEDRWSQRHARELWRRVRRLESDASLRADARGKGTGAFHLKDAEGVREFVIHDGPQLRDFHEFLVRATGVRRD